MISFRRSLIRARIRADPIYNNNTDIYTLLRVDIYSNPPNFSYIREHVIL